MRRSLAPSEVRGRQPVRPIGSPRRTAALMRFVAPRSVVCDRFPGISVPWDPADARICLAVPDVADHGPLPLSRQVHSPASFTSTSEHDRLPPAPSSILRSRGGAPPMGFAPSSRCHWLRPRLPGAPTLRASVRPRRFARPRRFPPLPALQACFIPQPRPGFALQGFVPHTEPHRVSPAGALLPLVAPRLRLPGPAFRALDFRALLSARVRCRPETVRFPIDPRPSWACASSGCSLRAS
jgi:hypothetical protein